MPTGNGRQGAGPLNQYPSIWNAVDNTLTGLQDQFDGVDSVDYWSGTESTAGLAWRFNPDFGLQRVDIQPDLLYAVAVRPGDVAASVPEQQTLALALLALGATMVARRRRPR